MADKLKMRVYPVFIRFAHSGAATRINRINPFRVYPVIRAPGAAG